MRFNIKFTVTKNNTTNTKFEVVDTEIKYEKLKLISFLKKKFPGSTIEILKVSQALSANAGTL